MKGTSLTLKLALALCCASVLAVSAFAVDCGQDPSNPACAPSFALTWTIQGSGQNHSAQSQGPVWEGSYWLVNFTPQSGNGFVFTGGQLTSNPADPFLSYSFGVDNKSNSNMIFNFDYTTALSGLPIASAQDFFSDRLLFNGSAGSSSVAPYPDVNYPYNFLQNSLVNGKIIPNFQLGTGCTASVGNPCSSAGPYFLSEAFSNPGTGTLEVKGQFILGPTASYGIQGETDLFPAPEPSSLLMLGSGVLGLSAMLRRRLQQ